MKYADSAQTTPFHLPFVPTSATLAKSSWFTRIFCGTARSGVTHPADNCITEISRLNTAVGFEEMTKREARRVGIALGITAVILVPGFFFVTGVSLPMADGIGMSEAENIRHFTWFRLVPPEWVTPGPDGLCWSWMKTESIARLVLVVLTWIAAIILVNPDKWKKRKSNTTPDGICQPADGSPKPSV